MYYVIFEWYLLRIMVFLVGGQVQKTLKKKKKKYRRKTLQNEEKEKRRIQGKSNNNNKHLWFYLLYSKVYFARKHSLKKVVCAIIFYLQFLCVGRCLKRSNDTPNLIWICISV